MGLNEERALAWVLIVIGLLLFGLTTLSGWREQTFLQINSSGMWSTVQPGFNSILLKVFAVLLILVGGILRLAAAIESSGKP